MLEYLLTFAAIAIISYIFNNIKDPEPVFGIYNRKGKWFPFKYAIFLLIFLYRRWKNSTDNDRPGYGSRSHEKPEDMDVAQPLSDHPKAFDAAFFIGANRDGFYMVTGTERRQMGIINGLFYLIIPGKGVLCSPKIPDTLLFGAKPNEFGTEGILFTPIEPMKTWRVTYNGKMKYQSDPTKSVNVSFDGEWTAINKYFDYDTDLHPSAMARFIAKEQWTKKYFEDLKSSHQSHYDQFGQLKAKFTVDEEEFDIVLDSFRDHSYGHKRDWELMHRYAFHHIFLADGQRISIGVVCQPCTSSSLEVGFIWTPRNGGENHPVKWCDLQLYQLGENGRAPTDYAFQFEAGDKVYTVQVKVQHQSEHFVSSHWDARMVERFATYMVNGVNGWGVSEFHYNNKSGRPEELSKDDPDWYQLLRNK